MILNCSSFAAVAPMAGKAPCAACKSGVLSLTRTMAAEFAACHIRVNACIPGGVNTEINKANVERYGDKLLQDIPMQRFGEPEEIAQAMVFPASDAAGYINGTALEITGGKRCTQKPLFPYEAERRYIRSQYSRYHKISFLAGCSQQSKCCLHMYQLWRSLCACRNKR